MKKLRNKGFTLVELIAIIVVITAIFLVALPIITKSSKDAENKKFNQMVNILCDAAKSYVYSNPDDFDLDETGDHTIIPVLDLIHYGVVDSQMTNPRDKRLVAPDTITVTAGQDLGLSCVYNKTEDIPLPTSSAYCVSDLVYDGTSQTLANNSNYKLVFDTPTTGVTAGNYTLTLSIAEGLADMWADGTNDPKSFTCSIGKASLTRTVSCPSKVYDGTTTANCTITVEGAASGDTLAANATCNYSAATIGTRSVTCTNFTLSGDNASSYTFDTSQVTQTGKYINNARLNAKKNNTNTYSNYAYVRKGETGFFSGQRNSTKKTPTVDDELPMTGYSFKGFQISGSSTGALVSSMLIDNVRFNGTKVAATSGDTHKGIVYLDPTDLSRTCTSSAAGTGVTSGCMKFYIFDDTGGEYKMILDHNTSGNVAWNSTANSASNLDAALERLADDTYGWAGNPRLITADEIAHIVGSDVALQWNQNKPWGTTVGTQSAWFYLDGSGNTYSGWQSQIANGTNKSSYAWLYDNLYGCSENGCNIQDTNQYPYPARVSSNSSGVYGYWTSDTVSDDSSCAWRINRQGSLNCNAITTNNDYGVRPVITLSKTIVDKVTFNGTKVKATASDTHKGIVYLNPSSPSTACNETLASQNLNNKSPRTPTGVTTGCLKFYIYDDTGDTYKLILDHNTSGNVAFNSNGTNTTSYEAATRLFEDTTGWIGGPRLITANEIAHIVGADSVDTIQWDVSKPYGTTVGTNAGTYLLDGGRNANPASYSDSNGWNHQYANSSVKSNYAWLYDYTKDCLQYGCNYEDNNTYPYPTNNSSQTGTIQGYWFQDAAVAGETSNTNVWKLTYTSSIRRNNVTESHLVGVRPVIELPKSFIDNPIRPNVADWTDEDSNWLITANKNIYTVYTPVRYSISYNLNGGSCSSCSTTQYNILTNTFSLPQNPTKSGATFLGWTGTNGNEPQKVVSITKGSTGNRSYTANWAHTKTIMLNSNCSTNLTNIYTTVTYKSTSNNVVPTSMTCSGKVFDGFWTSTTGGTRVYNADGHYNSEATTYWASDGTWNVNNSTSETLYAHWLPAITVTLDYNDGETANSTISVGQGQTYWRLPTPTRTGYEFNGWVNGVWVPDKTLAAWVASLADNAFVTANFKPNTTYTIEYDVTLNEPIPSGYTASQTGQWGGIGFKKDSTYTVANGKLYNLATPNYVVGQKYHVINTITTPADLSNVSMVFYTARSTNSSSQGYTINGTFSDIVFYESKIDTSTTVTQSSAHTLKAVWEPYKPYALGELVRYNPVNNQKCTGGTTCYKWRAIVANDTSSNANITLQMDYNLVNSVAWASKADYNDDPNYGSTGNNNKGPITALKALETATASWDNSLKLNYTYDVSLAPSNYGSLSCTSGTCTAAGNTITTNLKARMITAEEMRAITLAAGAATGTNADNWNQTNGAWYYFSNTEYIIGRQTSASNSSGSTVLSWLIENTTVDSTSGATNNTYGDNNTGYWTLTPGTVCADCAHRIAKTGRIYNDGGVSYDTTAGVRPVITIPKSIFE